MGKRKGKSKREARRERKEREAAERQAAEARLAQRRRRLAVAAVALPLVTLAGALAVYFGTDDRQLAALAGLVGMAAWVPILLGLVGGGVPPRKTTRAGSIDFGHSNER